MWKARLISLMKEADVIIPLAAFVGAPMCTLDPVGASTVNHDAIMLMLKHLSKDQIVLMPTTNSAYGTGDEKQFLYGGITFAPYITVCD